MLADYGAMIVRSRIAHPYRHRAHSGPVSQQPNRPRCLGAVQQSATRASSASRSISAIRAAREIILDLVRWADVVTESFSPKAMRAWGLDYPAIRKIKPDIIMLSSCLMGQTGPLAKFRGLRKSRGRDFGLLQYHRMARSIAGRAVRRVHRLRFAALHRDRDSGRARISAPHRQGAIHRSVAGRSVAAFSDAGATRLQRQRAHAVPRRQ